VRLVIASVVAGFILGPPGARAQAGDPAFAVASIKPSKAQDFRREGIKFLPGGRFVAANYPLQVLIAGAYHVPYQSARLTGGPEWVRSERWDVEAKAAPDALPAALPPQARTARMRRMLQNLLAERFRLTLRRETKELPVYALVVAKNGLRLEKSKIGESDCFGEIEGTPCHVILGGQGRGLDAQAADLADLAVALENFTDRPVVDQTGIIGLFQIETTAWLPLRQKAAAPGVKAENGADLESLPSLFSVMSAMGLKLVPQRAAIELLVIDHVERPSRN
jgi:uncharacterized protein (TIGR03435 family)